MGTKSIRQNVFLAIPDRLLRDSLSAVLGKENHIKSITGFSDGRKLLAALKKNGTEPAVCLLDLRFRGSHALLEDIGTRAAEARPLVLSALMPKYLQGYLISRGARGFLQYDSPIAEVLLAIRGVADKGFYFTKKTPAVFFEKYLEPDAYRRQKFTKRQMEFLHHSSASGSYSEIGDRMGLAKRSVEKLRDELFKKFDVNNRTDLLIVAVKSGLVSI